MPGIADINWLYKNYYGDNPHLRGIVSLHSKMVAKKALDICRAKKLGLDERDVFCAAMLHDIGVVKCSAPEIGAKGTLPYLQHGLEGKKILEKAGLPLLANVCATHTGSGITAEEIIRNNLPLPPIDLLPVSLLEKLICYADKFYSKSGDLTEEKSFDSILNQMHKFGEDSLERFLSLHQLFKLT